MRKADTSTLPPLVITEQREIGELASGLLDVMLAFGCALAERGLLERQEIAARMEKVLQQQTRREGGAIPAVQYPAEALRLFFSAPVMQGGRGRAGLVPIDGGRNDDPSAA